MSQLYLRDFCEREEGWLLETVETLVGLESPTTDKAAVDRCGAELARRMTALGATVRAIGTVGRGDHLVARVPGSTQTEAAKPVLILGHFDTVWPFGQLERMPLERRDGRLHGPGVFDMKAGIGIALLAVRALAAAGVPHRPITLLWTTDEEVGSGTSRALLEAEALASEAVLVLEPSLPGGAVKTSRKGCGEYHLSIEGVAAHAGIDPRAGASAIHELARQVLAIEQLQDLDRGVSVNVGVVAGGSRPNVTAERATAVIDVRVPTAADAARVDAGFRSLTPSNPRIRLSLTGGIDRPPLERTAGVARLYEQARRVAASLGIDLAEGGTGGGSDGNFTAALGIPTLDGLGAVGDGAHALHEHVELGALARRAALVAGLLASL